MSYEGLEWRCFFKGSYCERECYKREVDYPSCSNLVGDLWGIFIIILISSIGGLGFWFAYTFNRFQ